MRTRRPSDIVRARQLRPSNPRRGPYPAGDRRRERPFRVVGTTNADKHAMDRLAILVVDDEPPVLAFAERVLGEAGYQVQTTTHGTQALQLIERRGYFDAL